MAYITKYSQPVTRKQLARWSSWFFCANTVLLLLVSLRYFSVIEIPSQPPAQLFSVIAFIGHFAFLTFAGFLLLLPVILLLPSRLLVTLLANILAVSLIIGIIIDTFVFEQYRFHLNTMVFSLIFGGAADEIFHFSASLWLIALAGLLIAIGLEWIVGRIIWHWLEKNHSPWIGRSIAGTLLIIFIAQHIAYAWADAKAYTPITKQVRYLPAYKPVTARSFFNKHDLIKQQRSAGNFMASNSDIDYPKATLQCGGPHNPANVILIVIDSWRADMLDPNVTPHVSEFAKSSWRFNNHFSGANSTRIGIFTLFYGIPGTYWHAMLAEKKGAELINEFVKRDYNMGVYASAKLTSPEFDRTVFAKVRNLRTRSQGHSPHERDRNITDEFKRFIDNVKNSKQPFFGFLFYDSPHAYDYPDDYPLPFQPSWDSVNFFKLNRDFDPTPFVNRYKNAVHYTDSLLGEVLDKIEQSGILKNTVVVITSDHGQEFNDNGQNYWGHNSNFSEYQTKVPFLVRWPGKPAATFNHLTSHFDLVPTLMSDLLSCGNNAAEYSVGKHLLDKAPPPYLLLSSYASYAIKLPDSVTVVDQFGQKEVFDANYYPSNKNTTPAKLLVKVMDDMSYFYKK